MTIAVHHGVIKNNFRISETAVSNKFLTPSPNHQPSTMPALKNFSPFYLFLVCSFMSFFAEAIDVKPVFVNGHANKCLQKCFKKIEVNNPKSAIKAGECFVDCLEAKDIDGNEPLEMATPPAGEIGTQIVACEAAAIAQYGVCMTFAESFGEKMICTATHGAALAVCVALPV